MPRSNARCVIRLSLCLSRHDGIGRAGAQGSAGQVSELSAHPGDLAVRGPEQPIRVSSATRLLNLLYKPSQSVC